VHGVRFRRLMGQRRRGGPALATAMGALAGVTAIGVAALAAPPVMGAQHVGRHASAPVHHRQATSTAPHPAPPQLAPGLGPPFAVHEESVNLVDPTRSTPARGSVPATQGRILTTNLFVPDGAPAPLPLVVFAHGWNSDPAVYQPLLERWAEAGFLVAAPIFPDSTDLSAGSPVSNYADQALDISFVISSLLPAKVDGLAIDPTRVAVAGHSDGGTDVALLALDPTYADSRVRAYVCLSGQMPSGVAPFTVAPSRAALFVAVGSADEYGLYPLATDVFNAAENSTKAMVVEEGGDHLGSFIGATQAAAGMREETTRFLELALEPRAPTSSAVVSALEPPSSPSLTVVPP
jgi:pimeloyl-ACP methyl ester carboxylesterase